jgi:chromosome segregation ATPase
MNQQEIERIDAEIEKKKQDLKDTTTRLSEAKETLGTVGLNLASARVKRQKALARGDNASKLTKDVDSSMSEQALTEDLITGLEDLLKEQGEQLTALEKGRKEAFYQMTVEEISVLVGEYNSQAAKLADIVKTLWDKRLLLGWGNARRMALEGKRGTSS